MLEIPIYQPSLTGNERKYVNECLDSSWISSKGKFISQFENEFAKFIDVKHAATVCNGTVALHLALITLGIGPNDEVIVPTLTYIASVNAIAYTGATPVFVDSVNDTWQMDPDDVKRKVTHKTKAILAVHLYGHPCELNSLKSICNEHNLFLIEDCAEAFGSKYNGKYVGTFGDISTFSFFGNKTITSGEGGMVVTNNETLYDRALHFKAQGLAKNRQYWHDVIGYNYRMTNICAAIGLAQLEQANVFIKKKKDIASFYREELKDSAYEFHKQVGDIEHSYWMCSFLVNQSQNRDKMMEFLTANGIETRPLFYPAHTMPMYALEHQKLLIAEDIACRGINIPSYPSLNYEQLKYIVATIKTFE